MTTLYLSQQGVRVRLHQEQLQVWQGEELVQEVQLPLLEQILVFGHSSLTTQAIRACLHRNIPIVYLSRSGYCWGRTISLERGYRALARQQQQLTPDQRLAIATTVIGAKLHNGRVLLQRQHRKRPEPLLAIAIEHLAFHGHQVAEATTLERLLGLEGAAAALYFRWFGHCLRHEDFAFLARSRRPPLNPVNALLSFGYQVLWNHLFALMELRGLDPYEACLHQGSPRHPALVSDLIEPFRSGLIDGLVLGLVNRRTIALDHFVYRDGGCFLNQQGRRVYLGAFITRMEQTSPSLGGQPRWELLNREVRAYAHFIAHPELGFSPYRLQ